ncbi:hypothetical protein GMA92_13875 [Turicibacter sanguinis]|uniref:Uncharacterized protein n=1 Tax=Turicibacter sanguinis TaxID=154288 RepID=A0A9X4XHB3_9FIRM|nr:hypothetical protein [Turicibacter sanguinis]MTK73756.1 hypothetical protein [Turicibacter sanguinis]
MVLFFIILITNVLFNLFSSDRTIQEYADQIWHVEPLKFKK